MSSQSRSTGSVALLAGGLVLGGCASNAGVEVESNDTTISTEQAWASDRGAPAPQDNCVFFEEPNLSHFSMSLSGGSHRVSGLFDVGGWPVSHVAYGVHNDHVSSVWIRGGYEAILYEHRGWKGKSLTLSGDGGDHARGDYAGGYYYNLRDFGFDDKMSSFDCRQYDPPEISCIFAQDEGLTGEHWKRSGDGVDDNLQDANWNGRITSVWTRTGYQAVLSKSDGTQLVLKSSQGPLTHRTYWYGRYWHHLSSFGMNDAAATVNCMPEE